MSVYKLSLPLCERFGLLPERASRPGTRFRSCAGPSRTDLLAITHAYCLPASAVPTHRNHVMRRTRPAAPCTRLGAEGA